MAPFPYVGAHRRYLLKDVPALTAAEAGPHNRLAEIYDDLIDLDDASRSP
jgi:hypothetical protein